MSQFAPIHAERQLSFLLYSAGKTSYMAMDGTVDRSFALYALPLLLEKCFTGTIKSEN